MTTAVAALLGWPSSVVVQGTTVSAPASARTPETLGPVRRSGSPVRAAVEPQERGCGRLRTAASDRRSEPCGRR